MQMNPLTMIDFYKASHRKQYPEGTTLVYSNFTPRSDKLAKVSDGKVVFFGLQYFIKDFLQDKFNKEFFDKPKDEVVAAYKRRMDNSLGKDSVDVKHIEALHDLGYLPLEIRALPEGTLTPIKVPMLTIHNTKPEFFWLTNYLESILSCYLWQPCTSASIARQYRLLLDSYAEKTGAPKEFVNFQAHDFSFRGMSSPQSAVMSGAGHLLFFNGTDTVPAIDFVEQYYHANSDKEPIGFSVPATEHSVMSMGGKQDEIETFRRLITKVHPTGIVSIVSDTWDLWKVLDEYAPALHKEITERNGKVVFRPDSGNPVDIICGLNSSKGYQVETRTEREFEYLKEGALNLLWKHFGGTINDKGYKVLDPHVGLIYGDSITLERAKEILERMEMMGFCSSNIVFGVGSFTYQYNTRDTYGFAMKATYGEINGVGRAITKDPVTDNGVKKSAVGLLAVSNQNGTLVLHDGHPTNMESALRTVFKDGKLLKDWTYQQVKENTKNDKS